MLDIPSGRDRQVGSRSEADHAKLVAGPHGIPRFQPARRLRRAIIPAICEKVQTRPAHGGHPDFRLLVQFGRFIFERGKETSPDYTSR